MGTHKAICVLDGMGWIGSLKHSHTRAPLCGAKKVTITMTLSKGVLTMQQLVLGDSVLTISRDKGLIYTEVG